MGKETVPSGNEGEPLAKSRAPRRSPQDQDQEIQNFISEARQRIQENLETPERLAKLLPLGFSATRLADGAELAKAAQGAFAKRQQAIGEREKASEQVRVAEGAARTRYVHFREAVRIATPDKTVHTALGVAGKMPRDAEKLLTAARASVKTAAEPAYAALASSVGYNTAGLAELTALLDTFAAARRHHQEISEQAQSATTARNAAVKNLRAFTNPFYRALRLVG